MDTRGIRYGLFSLLLTLAACRPDSPPAASSALEAQDPPAMTSSGDPRETWDVMTLSGQPVGYQVTRMRELQENSELLKETIAKSEMNVQRFGQNTSQRMELVSRETADGQLREFVCTINSGQRPIRTQGVRQNDVLTMTTVTEGNQQSWTIPVPNPCGGLLPSSTLC